MIKTYQNDIVYNRQIHNIVNTKSDKKDVIIMESSSDPYIYDQIGKFSFVNKHED